MKATDSQMTAGGRFIAGERLIALLMPPNAVQNKGGDTWGATLGGETGGDKTKAAGLSARRLPQRPCYSRLRALWCAQPPRFGKFDIRTGDDI